MKEFEEHIHMHVFKGLGSHTRLMVMDSQLPLENLQLKPPPAWEDLLSIHLLQYAISSGDPTSSDCLHMQDLSKEQMGGEGTYEGELSSCPSIKWETDLPPRCGESNSCRRLFRQGSNSGAL